MEDGTDKTPPTSDPRSVDPAPVGPEPVGLRPPVRLTELVLVFAGGAVGSLARYGVGLALGAGSIAGGWPIGTFAVNLVGAFLLGVLVESLGSLGPDTGRRRAARLLLGTGALGGFTTYSMFATEVAQMLLADRLGAGIAYAAATLVIGGAASWGGVLVGRGLVQRGPGRRRPDPRGPGRNSGVAS